MDAAWPEYPGATPRPAQAAGPPRSPNHTPEFQPFGADGLTFADVLDVVNPLQHIPVVSTIYRAVTGDSIAPAPRLLGGALFGGVIGAIGAVINVIVDTISGRDLGEHVVAMVRDDDGNPGGLAGSGRGARVAALDPAFDMPFYDSSALDPTQSLAEIQPWARKLLAERALAATAESGPATAGGGDAAAEPEAEAVTTKPMPAGPTPAVAAVAAGDLPPLNPAIDMPFYDSSALDPKQSLPEVQGWARRLMAEHLALAARHAVAADRYVETTAATAASAAGGSRVDVKS